MAIPSNTHAKHWISVVACKYAKLEFAVAAYARAADHKKIHWGGCGSGGRAGRSLI